MARFGFTATELERQRLTAARATSAAVSRRTSTSPARWPTNSSATSCRTSRFPASSTRTALYQRFLPEITLAEINSLAKDWMPDRNRVVVVSAPRESRRDRARRGEARGGDRGGRRRPADGLRRHGQRASRCSTRCRRRAAIATTADEGRASASPNGSCRTASASCSSRRRSSRTRSCSARSARAARRSRADHDFIAADTAEPGDRRGRARHVRAASTSARSWPARPRSSAPTSAR